jgi:hypothetical protein
MIRHFMVNENDMLDIIVTSSAFIAKIYVRLSWEAVLYMHRRNTEFK